MWNARMPWGFNHDPCHETIYHQEWGEGFERVDLPQSIRQIGLNEGQSWMNPTKFVTDALVLEEKLISEGNMLEEPKQYHFWYIGKSYYDAHECHAFPLGDTHKREYARRAIWYFAEWIKHVYKQRPFAVDESAYNALIFSAEARRFLNEWDEAVATYKQAEVFAPIRNDHFIGLAQCYEHLKQYDKMLEVATKLIDPTRTNPFPHSASFINNEHYVDTGTLPARLYKQAQDHVEAEKATPALPFYINTRQAQARRMFVVDNFYANPDEIRNYALTQVEYEEDNRWYKGMRSTTVYRPKGMKEAFEHIIGQRIVDFESGYNGVFQIMRSHDQQVYHYDTQRWAGMIYLSPNAPIVSGTRMHKSKINDTRHRDEAEADFAFQGDFYDSTKFDITDSAANIYNRLLIMDAGAFHSAGPYFGNTKENGRLTHLFFFD
jgi:tetratricopeptide (TPR) repeat protein